MSMSTVSEQACLHLLVGHCDLRLPMALTQIIQEGDALLLMQEAVWLALAEVDKASSEQAMVAGVAIYVLQFDLNLRGLGGRKLRPGISSIDDIAWVQLSEKYPRCMTWTAR